MTPRGSPPGRSTKRRSISDRVKNVLRPFDRLRAQDERGQAQDEPGTTISAAVTVLWGAFALAVGVSLNRGVFSSPAIEWTCGGFVLVMAAVVRAFRPPRVAVSTPDALQRHYELLYAGLIALGLFQWQVTPAWDYLARAYVGPCATLGAIFVVAVVIHALLPERFRRLALWLAVVGAAVVWGLNVHYQPRPVIDVWQLQQGASDHLVHGHNPYAQLIENSSRNAPYGYRIDHYDYLPLNLLAGLPGYVLGGDYRYTLVACMFVIVAMIQLVGRRLQVAPRFVDLCTFAFLLHPSNGFCMIEAWVEPMLLAAVALFVYFAVRASGGAGESVSLWMVPMMKPYFLAPMLAYVPMLRPRWRSLGLAALVALATVLPFLIWNFRATVEYGLLFTLQHVPFRTDALSIPAWLHHTYHWQCGKLPALCAQLGVGAICFALLRRRRLGGFLLLSGASLYASFLAGSQAFTNYYFVVGGLLVLAALVLVAPGQDDCKTGRRHFPIHLPLALEPPGRSTLLSSTPLPIVPVRCMPRWSKSRTSILHRAIANYGSVTPTAMWSCSPAPTGKRRNKNLVAEKPSNPDRMALLK